MHGATRRVRSLHATLVTRHRPAVSERAMERHQARFGGGGGSLQVVLVGGHGEPAEMPEEFVTREEVWAEAGRWRQEHHGEGYEHVHVQDGDRWWSWSPGYGLSSSEDQSGVSHSGGLGDFDPSVLLAGTRVESLGRAECAGRPAVRVRVLTDGAGMRPSEVGPGIDEVEVLLDAERGILLRRVDRFEGEEATVREVESIAYDEALPPETFTLELPPDAPTEGSHRPTFTTLDAAAGLASFPVYKLAEVPPRWRVHGIHTPQP